jgi:hypothetical protein
MSVSIRNAVIVLAVLITTSVVSAHHSYNAVFDVNNKVALTGTLTKVDWRNPHIALFLDVKNSSGHVDAWTFEASPPSVFARRGVPKAAFQKAIGSTVSVEAYRAKDARLFGSLLKLTFADGAVVLIVDSI